MAEAIKYPKSPSGFYSVKLNAPWAHQGFLYKPSQSVTLNEDTLKAAIADGVIAEVLAA